MKSFVTSLQPHTVPCDLNEAPGLPRATGTLLCPFTTKQGSSLIPPLYMHLSPEVSIAYIEAPKPKTVLVFGAAVFRIWPQNIRETAMEGLDGSGSLSHTNGHVELR